ncbi:MAG TPA: alpha/beta hydrolase [Longimicrobium sp.]|nr:alpha/beta hydrolase [Longimicrobium sp.]
MSRRPPRVLIVPGWENSGPDHWQSLWEREDPHRFRRVQQRDWNTPDLDDWVRALDDAITAEPAPVVLAAHSLGCIAIAHWAAWFDHPVVGALLVAPADVDRADTPEPIRSFAPVPLQPLPFRSILVASSTDPYLSMDRAWHFARCWGSELVPIGYAGHINTAAGFGPWPEGERLLESLSGNER